MPARQQSKIVVLHTNGGPCRNGSLFSFFNRPGNDIASHFQIANTGAIEQYIDTAKQAYAAFASNAFAVQIETEDDGDSRRPWTAAQMRSVVAICRWLGVPGKVAPDGPGGGVGWHELYPDWNQSGHACPGAVRVAQIRDVIIPALTKPAAPYDFRQLKVAAVAIAKDLRIANTVNVAEPTKGAAFVKLLELIGVHQSPAGVDYRVFKHWLISAANGLHIAHDGVIESTAGYGTPARNLTIAIAKH
jgi:hypothetical protein